MIFLDFLMWLSFWYFLNRVQYRGGGEAEEEQKEDEDTRTLEKNSTGGETGGPDSQYRPLYTLLVE